MNSRQRFNAVMHYQRRDRSPIMDFGFWDETLVIWQEQGLPKGIDPDRYFGMDPQWITAPVNVQLCPSFDFKVLEDRADTQIVVDNEGVTKEQGKFLGSIPRHIAHTLVDRTTWEKEFKWRLDGHSLARFPHDWEEYTLKQSNGIRDYPLGINAGSLYGWIRNWMGLEAVSVLVYDDRRLFDEMVETIADCILAALKRALASGIQFDYALMWEDMCYRAGPLLSPRIFKETLVPHYRRITQLLKEHGVDVVVVDCDGDITKLLPLWLEAGVNTMFPLEAGVWQADPVAYRERWGPDLLMIGGVGKRILAAGTDVIDAEVERLAPLVEAGGYIPTPDHRVPPDVPFANYLHYLRAARRVWGNNLSNLAPMLSNIQPTSSGADDKFAWHLG